MSDDAFNLIEQPWIRCRTLNGDITELSLRNVFVQAPQLRGLAGELPTQDAAILRLLLAIVHRAYAVHDEDAEEAWSQLWQCGSFPAERLDSYFTEFSHRFNLFDAQAPFYQVADLHTAKNEWSSLHRLIAEVPSGTQFFTTRADRHVDSLSLAEAARWLVHCQTFDTAGIKSGAVGDPRVKGGKGYPNGLPSWGGNLGIIIVEGSNLFKTLMLNLVLDPEVLDPDTDAPQWERPLLGAAECKEHPQPVGVTDLLTWSDRRLRLHRNGNLVDGVLIANGDFLHPLNKHRFELMTSWRSSDIQAKKHGLAQAFMPITHDSTRDFWRGMSGLLAQHSHRNQAAAQVPIAGTLAWLATLRWHEYLDATTLMRIRAVGVEYGGQNATVDNIVDDAVTLHIDVMAQEELKQLVVNAVDDAEQAVWALKKLAGRLCRASGGDPLADASSRDAASAKAYYRIKPSFEVWVAQVNGQTPTAQLHGAWQWTVRGIIKQLAQELMKTAGRLALIGREVKDNNTTGVMDTARAEILFYAELKKTLPLAVSPENDSATNEADTVEKEPVG